MSLTQCKECHKDISTFANKCPSCGHQSQSHVWATFLLLIAVVVSYFSWKAALSLISIMILYLMFG